MSDCTGCALSRRAFLRDVLTLAATLPIFRLTGVRLRDHLHSYPIPAEDGAGIDRDNQVILVRFEGHAYAFALSCPHQNTALRWREGDQQFQCPKHHSKYRPDGTFISGRATRGMDRFAVRRDGNDIVVDLDRLYKDDEDHEGWLAAVVAL